MIAKYVLTYDKRGFVTDFVDLKVCVLDRVLQILMANLIRDWHFYDTGYNIVVMIFAVHPTSLDVK